MPEIRDLIPKETLLKLETLRDKLKAREKRQLEKEAKKKDA